jgi:CDP-diacylglycerol--serine O-phosphatidyltransferase
VNRLGNMMCGFLAILVSIRGEQQLAAVLIGLSVLFDITDGAVARLVGAVTPFGLQFDSLADLVSFGMAPALVAFTLFSEGRDGLDPLGWVACALWLACAAIRLARFNTTIDPTADKRFFIGMPSPGAAGVVLASVFAFGDQMQGRDRLWVLLIVAVPAVLMVSTIRFRSFRSLVSPKSRRPYGLVATAVLLVVGFATVPVVTGCALAYGYLLAPVLVPLLAPLGRLVPDRLKEVLT